MARRSQPPIEGTGYIRVSRVAGREGDSYITEDVQRDAIERTAEAKGIRITRWRTDRDRSGGNDNRPEFQAALADVETGATRVVVVARLTRFARSVLDTHRAIARLEAAGGRLVSADMDVDTSTAMGKMVRGILAQVAEFELELIKEQWVLAKTTAFAKGKYLATSAPFGYRFDTSHRLVKDEDEAAIVRQLFRLAGGGASINALAAYLLSATGRPYHRQVVRSMIRNRAYVGEASYGGATKEGAHEAIVTADEWKAAQREPRRGGLKQSGTHSLLAGIARCHSCGRKMVYSSSGNHGRGIYKCPRNPVGLCKEPSAITTQALDVYVIEAVRAWARGEGLEDKTYDVRPAEDELEAARAALEAANAALEAFAEDSTELDLSREAIRKGLNRRQETVRAASDRVDELEAIAGSAAARTTLRQLWPELTTGERRQLIGSVVERASVRRRWAGASIEDRVTIKWRE